MADTAPGLHVQQQQGWACARSRHLHSPALTSSGAKGSSSPKPGSDPAWTQAQQQDSHWDRALCTSRMHWWCILTQGGPGARLDYPKFSAVFSGFSPSPSTHVPGSLQGGCKGTLQALCASFIVSSSVPGVDIEILKLGEGWKHQILHMLQYNYLTFSSISPK